MAKSRDPAILDLRRKLAAAIVESLGEDSQWVIAPSYGIPQPRMSELNRGIVDRCSVEWLIRRVHRLGGTVHVTVSLGDARRAWYVEHFNEMRRRRGQPIRRTIMPPPVVTRITSEAR